MAPDDTALPDASAGAAGPRTWGLRRVPSPVALSVGGLIMAGLLAFLLGGGEFRESTPAVVAFAAAFLLGMWSLALLFDPAPADARRRRPFIVGVVAWVSIALALRWLWLAAMMSWPLIGNFERLLFLPVLALALTALGRRLGLGTWITRLAIVAIVILGLRESIPADWPTELVAAAGPAELAGAQRAAAGPAVLDRIRERNFHTPIALAGIRHDHGMPVAPPPARAGMRCQRIKAYDQRRTLLGAEARRLQITADACWTADGKPYTVRLLADARAGDTQSNPHAVDVRSIDPFRVGRAPDEPFRWPTERAPRPQSGIANIHPFDDQARLRIGGPSHALVRVDPTGRRIELVIGWLLADPLVRRGRQEPGVVSDAYYGREHWQREIGLGFRPRRGEVLDLFTAEFDREVDPSARLVRINPGGFGPYLVPRAPGKISHPARGRTTLDLVGGR